MELQFYWNVLKRRFFSIVVVAAATLLVVSLVGLIMPPVYTARTTIRILLDLGVADLRLGEDYNKRLLNTYATILKSTPVLEKAIDQLAPRTVDLTPAVLREAVTTEVVVDTELLSILVENGDPVLARDLANIFCDLLIDYARDLYTGSDMTTLEVVKKQLTGLEEELKADRQTLETLVANGEVGAEVDAIRNQIQFKEDSYDRLLDRYELARLNGSLRANSISVIAPATIPQEPSNSLTLSQLGLSLVVGLFVGVGVALVMENVDTSIRSSLQLEHLADLPVLGIVPSGLLSMGDPSPMEESDGRKQQALEEAYRLLGVNLPALKDIVSVQTILITSAVPREGKSTVAANLAQILAERGRPIFLVECDLRRPTLLKTLGIHCEQDECNLPGLTTLLVEKPPFTPQTLGEVVHATKQPELLVIGGGGLEAPNPTALLGSSFMEEFVGYLGTQGHMTLLNAPPVLGMADVSVLAPKVEGVVLVVREGYSKREQVLAALKQLTASHSHVFGFVFVQHSGEKSWSYD